MGEEESIDKVQAHLAQRVQRIRTATGRGATLNTFLIRSVETGQLRSWNDWDAWSDWDKIGALEVRFLL